MLSTSLHNNSINDKEQDLNHYDSDNEEEEEEEETQPLPDYSINQILDIGDKEVFEKDVPFDEEDEVIEQILTTNGKRLDSLADLLEDWRSSDDEDADNVTPLKTSKTFTNPPPNILNADNSLITIEDINRLVNAKDTYKYRRQAKKHWYNYLKTKLRTDTSFNDNEKKYASNINSIFQYMLDIRRFRYSYSTTFGYSYNIFIQYIKHKNLSIEEARALRKKYKIFLRGLRRMYGKQVKKVKPLLNKDRDILVDSLNINKNKEALLRSLILQARSRGLRGDSFEYLKLSNISFIPITIKRNNKTYMVLNSRFIIEKDKILLKTPRIQMLIGNNNLSKCPNIALAFYLFYFRQVFVGKDFMTMIINPTIEDWKIKDECLNQSLWVQTDGKTSLTSENMSEYICQLSIKIFGKEDDRRYRMRSCRSGLTVVLLMKLKHGGYSGNWENYKEKIRKYIGWKSLKMVDYYDREISTLFDDSGIIGEQGGEEISNEVIKNLLLKDNIHLEIGLKDNSQSTLKEFEDDILVDEILDIWTTVKDLSKIKSINDIFNEFDKDQILKLPLIRMTKELSCFIRMVYGDQDEILQESTNNINKKTNKNHNHAVDKAIQEFVNERFPEEELDNLKGHPQYLKEQDNDKKKSLLFRLKKQYVYNNWDKSELYDYCNVNSYKIIKKGNKWTWKLIENNTHKEVQIENNNEWYKNYPIYNTYIKNITDGTNKVITKLTRQLQDSIKKAGEIMEHHKINKSLHKLKFTNYKIKVDMNIKGIDNLNINNIEGIEMNNNNNNNFQNEILNELEDKEIIEKEDDIIFDEEDEEFNIKEVNQNNFNDNEIFSDIDDDDDVEITLED
ncbi:hypothetical protein ABK040_012170 [Willaertia magna]